MICMNCGQSVRKIDILNMTDEQKRIVDLVMEPLALLNLVLDNLSSHDDIRDGLFVNLVDHWVVHSELCLSHAIGHIDIQDIKSALSEMGIPFSPGAYANELLVTLTHIKVTLLIDLQGYTSIVAGKKGARFQLTATSVVKLILFANDVLLDLEAKASRAELEMDKSIRISHIAATTLRARLYDPNRPIDVSVSGSGCLDVRVFLHPDGQISLPIYASEVDRFIENYDIIVRSAEMLHALLGSRFQIDDLNRWDWWAYPFNGEIC